MRHLSLFLLLVPLHGCLDYDTYLKKFRVRYCDEMAKCNPDFECNVPTADDTGYTSEIGDCEFDAKLARDCLNGTWTCEGPLDDPDFQYPVGPEACSAVCGTASVPE